MMSLIHWFSSSQRLEACERTILSLGGSRDHDDGVPTQLAAQRDMIKYEVKYYKERAETFIFYSIMISVLLLVIGTALFKLGVI